MGRVSKQRHRAFEGNRSGMWHCVNTNDLTGETMDMNRCSPVREDTPLVTGRTCRNTESIMTGFYCRGWVKWVCFGGAIAIVLATTILTYVFLFTTQGGRTQDDGWTAVPRENSRSINVAFIGNSIMYFNDLPRFMEALSQGCVRQDSCLHGEASLASLLVTGNGMYTRWNTSNARILGMDDFYDFGACTVPQLLFGFDRDLEKRAHNISEDVLNDGMNPCLQDEKYRDYHAASYSRKGTPHWDFVFMSDLTRNPCRYEPRQQGLQILRDTYIPWFHQTGAIPVLMHTHAYWNTTFNVTDLKDIPTFTSLTFEGVSEYAVLLEHALSTHQKPRIAMVGIAYLTIWEEDYSFWLKLFHSDHLHPSPMGSFLQGCILYYTLFGTMPDPHVVIRDDMSKLWSKARLMQPATDPPNPFPTKREAKYLYQIADRVMRQGHRPHSFIVSQHGEASNTTN